MHLTQSGMDQWTDRRTYGWTVRLLYAFQSFFGGIKTQLTPLRAKDKEHRKRLQVMFVTITNCKR